MTLAKRLERLETPVKERWTLAWDAFSTALEKHLPDEAEKRAYSIDSANPQLEAVCRAPSGAAGASGLGDMGRELDTTRPGALRVRYARRLTPTPERAERRV